MALTTVQTPTTIHSLSDPVRLQPHPKSKSQKVNPDQILAQIFSKLSVQDTYKCRQVCKDWKRVADSDEVWRKHVAFTLRLCVIPHFDGLTYQREIQKTAIKPHQIPEKYQEFLQAKHSPDTFFVVINLATSRRYTHIIGETFQRRADHGFKRKIVYICDDNCPTVKIDLMLMKLLPKSDTSKSKEGKGSFFTNFKKRLHLTS